MMNNTILVVDADPETEEKIVSTLEAENYLVFTASGQYFSGEMIERTSPSLIFLKPAALNVEGFQTCKAIHNIEAFRNVPIVVLASLKVPLDSRYTTFYGIVDFLKMPLNARDIIEKTEKILGSRSRSVEAPEEDFELAEESPQVEEPARLQDIHSFDSGPGDSSSALNESSDDFEPVKKAAIPAEGTSDMQDYGVLDTEEEEISETGQLNEDDTYREEQGGPRELLDDDIEQIPGSRSRDIEAPEEDSGLSAESPLREDTLRLQVTHEFDSELGVSSRDLQTPEDDFKPVKRGVVPGEEKSEIQDDHAFDTEDEGLSENGQPKEEEAYREEQDSLRENVVARKPHKQAFLIPVIIAISAIAIVAAGFLFYNYIAAAPDVKPVAVNPPRAFQQQETAVLPLPEQQQQEQPLPDAKPEGIQEAPKKAPAIVPEEKSVSNTVYSVQIGAFKSKGAADSLAKQYKRKGYRTFTREGTTKDNLIVYRVLIGQYEDRIEAVRSAGKIQARQKISTIIFAGKTQ
jgi:cell division septation protein DedD/CheY-like chemotaxis protein